MTPIDQLRTAGFSDDEIGRWASQQRSTLGAAGFSDDEIDSYLGGPKKPTPPAFLERIGLGDMLAKALKANLAAAVPGADNSSAGRFFTGFTKGAALPGEELKAQLPAMSGAEQAGSILGRVPTGGIIDALRGAGESLRAALGGKPISADEMINNALFGLTPAAGGRLPGGVARLERAPTGEAHPMPLGEAPQPGDFADAAKVAANTPAPLPQVQEKLEKLWDDHGIHPAEVAHDAAGDPTIAQDLFSSSPELPRAYVKPSETPAPASEPAPGGGPDTPPQLRTFAPSDLKVDARRFQFKEGGDEAGVTDRLQGVTQWDPVKAGLGLVYEDKDGAHWIADGHQRLGLAQRIEAADPAQQPRLNAWVMREADGVTDADMRAIAAAKNIAEGTGSAIDAGKVLRDRPDLMDSLPPRSELVRQARGLANLDPEAFGKVVNDVVPPNYAAIVGRLVENDAKMQNALIDLLAKTHPENAVQAESIVRQGMDAGLHTETQATLFGNQELVSSLYADRARILDRALKQLRRDRTVFQSIVDNSAIIEDLGNRLAQDANARRAAIDGHASQILQTLANRRGALSDALTAAARAVADKQLDLAAAARDFVAEIRRQAESGDLVRSADGGRGGAVAAPREGAATPHVAAEREQHPRVVSPVEEARAVEIVQMAVTSAAEKTASRRLSPGEVIDAANGDKALLDEFEAQVRRHEDFTAGFAARFERNPNVEFTKGGHTYFASRNIGGVDQWRLTSFRNGEPTGHMEFSNLKALAQEAWNLTGQGYEMRERSLPTTERTIQGDQLVIPGAERSAVQAAAGHEAEGRGKIAPPTAQQEPGGLFAPQEAPQPGLFERLAKSEEGTLRLAEPPLRTEAERTVLSRINVGGQTDRRPWSWSRLYTAVWDRLHPLEEMVASAGEELPTGRNPYKLARLVAGVAGKADHWLNHGQIDFKTYRTIGPSLKEILAPVAEDLDGFRAFAASVRTLELEKRGIETGMSVPAAREVAARGVDQYAPILARLIQFQDSLSVYLRDAGVLSPKGYEAMREANRLYVPFYRVIGDEPGAVRGSGGTLQAQNPIHRIKGSEREIVDPIESIIRNTYLYVTMAERNAVGTSIVDLLRKTGDAHGAIRDVSTTHPRDTAATPATHLPAEARPVPTTSEAGVAETIRELLRDQGLSEELFDFVASAVPPREGEIAIFRQGKRETWQVGDDIAAAVKALDTDATNTLVRMLAMPARMLRAGATLTPDFALRNIIRDFSTAFVQTSTGVFNPLRSARGLYSAVVKDEHFQEWLKGGGGNSSLIGLDRQYLQENLRKLTADAGLMNRAWNVVSHPIEALRMLSELSEQMTRLGEFRAVRERELEAGATPKEASQAAAFASREVTIDFARMGAKMRGFNMAVAFLNATLQGSDRIVRAFHDDPVRTGIKIAAGITAPSVLLWWANHDDPRYHEIPQWERDLFWIVMTKDHIYRIPKPFELGVLFGSGVERLLDAFVAEKPDAFAELSKSIMGALLPSVIPTAALPIAEQWANRSSFTDRNLIPASVEKLLPEYQYNPYTTETAKKLGQVIAAFPGMRDASIGDGPASGVARGLATPILLENYLRGWTGGLGMYALQLADAGLRKAGVVPDPPKPEDTLADIPVVKAFVVRHPSAGAESIQRFYDDYTRNKRYFDSWMAKAQEGDAEALQRIQDAGGPRLFVQLDGIRSTLAEHSKLVRDIWKDPEMSPSDKRQLIDQLYSSETAIAQGAREMMRQVDSALATVH